MKRCFSCLGSCLEDKCSEFESVLDHYSLSNGLFTMFWFSNLSSVADVLRKSLHYCNKMNRFAETFRVPGEMSIYSSNS